MTVKKWTPPSAHEIKQLRLENDFSQAKTAHLCRIGLKTYQKWENGDAHPSQSAWAIYMVELEARKLGFESISELLNSLK